MILESTGVRKRSPSPPYIVQKHCLVPVPAPCLTIAPVPDNLQRVPPVYLEFKDIFDKKRADCLPQWGVSSGFLQLTP